MTKRSVKSIIAVLMILTIALYFISGTYARYTDSWEGTGTVAVAKWNVTLKSGGESVEQKNLTLKFTPVANKYVVSGKIAPDVELEADVEIDLDGTEVAVDVKAEVNEESLKTALTNYGTVPEDIKVTAKIDNEDATEKTIELPDGGSAFGPENGKKILKINVKWTNVDLHSESDTKAGKAAEELDALEIPVTLTVQQHVLSDDTP